MHMAPRAAAWVAWAAWICKSRRDGCMSEKAGFGPLFLYGGGRTAGARSGHTGARIGPAQVS